MPFVFGSRLALWFDVFASKDCQCVFQGLSVTWIDISECFQRFLWRSEWNWFTFICTVVSGCVLINVWKRSSKSSNLSLLPLKVIGVEFTYRIVNDWVMDLLCISTTTSASLWIGSRGVSVCGRSNNGRVVLNDILWSSSGWRFCWDCVLWETQEQFLG